MIIKWEDVKDTFIAKNIYFTNVRDKNEDDILNGIDIILKVDGKEVNFLDYIDKFDKALEKASDDLDNKILEKAKELLDKHHTKAEDKLRMLLNKLDDVEDFIDKEFY